MLTTTALWLLFSVHAMGGVTTVATFPDRSACVEAAAAMRIEANREQRHPLLLCAEIKRTYTR